MKKLLVSIMLLWTANTYAIMPVIDYTEIAKTIELIERAKDQQNTLLQMQSTNQSQLTTQNHQYEFLQKNLSGSFGYGNLYNTQADLNQRQWSNNTWQDVLNMASSGNVSAFIEAQKTYQKLYPISDSSFVGHQGDLKRTQYEQQSKLSRAALAASSYSYNQINQHIQTIHDILAKLEQSSSEKAAIDLNTRLVAELSFINLEMLKQQNIQTQLAAIQSQSEVNGMSDEAKFMKVN